MKKDIGVTYLSRWYYSMRRERGLSFLAQLNHCHTRRAEHIGRDTDRQVGGAVGTCGSALLIAQNKKKTQW